MADRPSGYVVDRLSKNRDGTFLMPNLGTEKYVFHKITSATDATKEIMSYRIQTTGTASAGLGVYSAWYVEDVAGNTEEMARLEVATTAVTNGAESASFKFYTKQAGTMANRFTISTDGSISSGGDINFSSAADMTMIDNNATALEIKNGATAYMTFDTTDSADRILLGVQTELADSTKLVFGTGDDITMAWDGTDFDILQATANSSVKWGVDGAGLDQVWYGDTASTSMTWDQSADSLLFTDNAKVVFGTGSDVTIAWDGTDLDILAAADNSVITIGATGNAFDLSVFGASAAVMTWDCSANSLIFADDAKVVFGTGSDVTIAWDGTDLDITAAADNSVITLGATGNAFDVSIFGSSASVLYWDCSANALEFKDGCKAVFGTGDDVSINWDATDLIIMPSTDDYVIKFGDGTTSFDLKVFGNTSGLFWTWDASASEFILEDSVSINFGTGLDVDIRWDGTDLDMLAAANNTIFKIGNGTNSFDVWLFGSSANHYISWDASANDLKFEDSCSVMFGTGGGAGPGTAGDVELRWDATDLDLLAAADDTVFKIGNGTNSFDVWLFGNTASDYLLWDASAGALTQVGAAQLRTMKVVSDPGNAGAIPVTTNGSVALTSAGAETRTLAIPAFQGQRMTLYCDTYVGDIVVTVAAAFNVANNTILTFGAVSEACGLEGVTVGGSLVWQIVWNDGVGLS